MSEIPTHHPEPLSRGVSAESIAELRGLFARWSTADANIDNWQTRHVREAVAAARNHLPTLLDQIAADRAMWEEVVECLERWFQYSMNAAEVRALLARLRSASQSDGGKA